MYAFAAPFDLTTMPLAAALMFSFSDATTTAGARILSQSAGKKSA
jgi:hypothetical protein